MNIDKSILKRCIVIMFLLTSFLVSCSDRNGEEIDHFPGITLSLSMMNKAIILQDSPAWANSYRNGEDLTLQIINQTEETLIFPSDYGIKIFAKNEQGWAVLQNNMTYPGSDKKLPPFSNHPGGFVIGVLPFSYGMQMPMTIRIFVFGHYENDDQPLGAYIDIIMKP